MNFRDLVKSGKLPVGTELVWRRKLQGDTHTAIVEHEYIRTSDGKLHKTPSGAARHLNKGKPVDGWKVWKIKSSGLLIDTLRDGAAQQQNP